MEWISVKDRLPEEGIDVLVFVEADGSHTDYMQVSKQWENGDVWTDVSSYDHVTHWMHLPDAPKQD